MKIKTVYIKLIFTILFSFKLNAQHLSFDGTNDYVEFGDVLDQNSSFQFQLGFMMKLPMHLLLLYLNTF